MSGMDVSIAGPDGSFGGYLAVPAGGKGPAVVVIQEIFGVNAAMRAICDRLAAQGFTALCPDLFWRQEPGIQITDKSEAEWAKAFELYKGFDVAKGMGDIQTTITFLRGHAASNGKVGTMGFCLGGLLAYLSACGTDADASVGYYGVGIEGQLDKAANIKKPLMLHLAEADGFVPPEAQAKIKDALTGKPGVTIHSYPGMDHAFARPDGQHWNPEQAAIANGRTDALLKAALA